MPLLPDLTILTFGEAQAHTHNFYLGWGCWPWGYTQNSCG